MSIVEHSVAWAEGEMFESASIAAAGALTISAGIAFRVIGTTAGAKAMLIPLLVAGGIFLASGTSGYFSNRARIAEFQEAHSEDPEAFVVEERARVEGFSSLFLFTMILGRAFSSSRRSSSCSPSTPTLAPPPSRCVSLDLPASPLIFSRRNAPTFTMRT